MIAPDEKLARGLGTKKQMRGVSGKNPLVPRICVCIFGGTDIVFYSESESVAVTLAGPRSFFSSSLEIPSMFPKRVNVQEFRS